MTKPDCYDYVRGYYHVPAYIGVRVKIRDREGVIVRAEGSTQYVHVRFDDGKPGGVYHPTDRITYIVEGMMHTWPVTS